LPAPPSRCLSALSVQAAAERVDCADFGSQLGVVQRSSAAASTSSAAADEIDRLHRSVKQHVEKIRFLQYCQTPAAALNNLHQDSGDGSDEIKSRVGHVEAAEWSACAPACFASLHLTRHAGSSEHQKILEQLKSDNQCKSAQVPAPASLATLSHPLHLRRSTNLELTPMPFSLLSKDEELRRLGRDLEAARNETLRAASAGRHSPLYSFLVSLYIFIFGFPLYIHFLFPPLHPFVVFFGTSAHHQLQLQRMRMCHPNVQRKSVSCRRSSSAKTAK
jgi:hypothetical protein